LSPLASSLYLNVRTVLSLVFGDLIQIFGYPQHRYPSSCNWGVSILYFAPVKQPYAAQ
jgi:hypothetical protein